MLSTKAAELVALLQGTVKMGDIKKQLRQEFIRIEVAKREA